MASTQKKAMVSVSSASTMQLHRQSAGGKGLPRQCQTYYVMESFDYLELNDGDNSIECLWVRIRGKVNKTNIMVGVYYKNPTRMKRQTKYSLMLAEVSQLLTTLLYCISGRYLLS